MAKSKINLRVRTRSLVKKIVSKSGRIPKYGERMTPRTINMPDFMYRRLGEEASVKETDHSGLARIIFEWYFDALDRQRGEETDAKEEFTKIVASENKNTR